MLLVVALTTGALASYAVKTTFFVDREAQTVAFDDENAPKERLLVANGELSAGTEINASNVRLVLTPEENAPRDGIFSFSDFVGRKLTRDYRDGEPISIYDVEETEENSELDSSFTPPGYTVVPFEIRAAVKANGSRNYLKTMKLDKLIKQGDLVDVVVVKDDFSREGATRRRRLSTTTIISGATVFSIEDAGRLGADGGERRSILSILLSADELELARKGSEEGRIRVVLSSNDRNEKGNGDTEVDYFDAFDQENSEFTIPDVEDEFDENPDSSDGVVPLRNETTPSLNERFIMEDFDSNASGTNEPIISTEDETTSSVLQGDDLLLDSNEPDAEDEGANVLDGQGLEFSTDVLNQVELDDSQVANDEFQWKRRAPRSTNVENKRELTTYNSGDEVSFNRPATNALPSAYEKPTIRANVDDTKSGDARFRLRSPFVTKTRDDSKRSRY